MEATTSSSNADPSATFARPRTASGALIRDQHDRILMVHPTYKDHWDLPGGYIEAGESPKQACQREVREELGLDLVLSGLLVVDWAPSEAEGDKLLFIFDGGQLTQQRKSSIRLPDNELKEFRYLTMTEIEARTPGRLSRRIRHAAMATVTIYLEHGHPLE